MQTITLGRTGLEVSVAGLGCGGHSRIGMKQYGLDHAAGLVRSAWEQGVTFFDTATGYGTQPVVGKGLAGLPRDSYVLSTKYPYKAAWQPDAPLSLEEALDQSLRELRTDYIDIYHLHGVSPQDYDQTVEAFLPALQKAQRQGKIRWLGITELFGTDTSHQMLRRALPDNHFDVIMTGYNLLNPSAAEWVLPTAMAQEVGVLCMFAVRSALSNPKQLAVDLGRILEAGQADPALVRRDETLSFLAQPGVADSVMEAAYRFCRHTPGIHVTLTGTGNAQHLTQNLESIQLPPLPAETLERLREMFSRVDCVSGQ